MPNLEKSQDLKTLEKAEFELKREMPRLLYAYSLRIETNAHIVRVGYACNKVLELRMAAKKALTCAKMRSQLPLSRPNYKAFLMAR